MNPNGPTPTPKSVNDHIPQYWNGSIGPMWVCARCGAVETIWRKVKCGDTPEESLPSITQKEAGE